MFAQLPGGLGSWNADGPVGVWREEGERGGREGEEKSAVASASRNGSSTSGCCRTGVCQAGVWAREKNREVLAWPTGGMWAGGSRPGAAVVAAHPLDFGCESRYRFRPLLGADAGDAKGPRRTVPGWSSGVWWCVVWCGVK